MLRWSLALLVIAFTAALLGFGRTASGAAEYSRACFHFSLGIFIVSVIWGLATGRGGGARIF